MNRTLELAIANARELPEAAQDVIGRAMLDWIERRAALCAEIQIGIDELDAGLGKPLDLELLLQKLNADYKARQ